MKHFLKQHENALVGLGVAPLVLLALIVGPRTIAGPYWGTAATFAIALACASFVWSCLVGKREADEDQPLKPISRAQADYERRCGGRKLRRRQARKQMRQLNALCEWEMEPERVEGI